MRLKQLPHTKSGLRVRKSEKFATIFTCLIYVIIEERLSLPQFVLLSSIMIQCMLVSYVHAELNIFQELFITI